MLREFGTLIDTGRIPVRSTEQIYHDMKQFWITVIGVDQKEATALAQMHYAYLIADDRANLLQLKELIPFYDEMVKNLKRYPYQGRHSES